MNIKRNYQRIRHRFISKFKRFVNYHQRVLEKDEINNLLKKSILESKPLMVTRLGFIGAIEYYDRKWAYDNYVIYSLQNNAGFFSVENKQNIDKFFELYLNGLKLADIVGVWYQPYENKILEKYAPNAILGKAGDISSPYFFDEPWTEALENKKVLVIHPFEESIKKQYTKREKLFTNKKVLPKFDLLTLKAVQSIAGNNGGFESWFKALDYMKEEIRKKDFDIAIIGAGAYGLPLAAFIKEIGKQAIHLGGATQILFGVKGQRWEKREDFKKLFNEYWINPIEKPKNFEKVEGGCYW